MAEPVAGTLMAAAMLLTAVVGLVCVLLHRPRRLPAVAGAATMAAAMLDMTLGYVVPPAIWAITLVAAGITLTWSRAGRAAPLVWDQGLCLLVAAGMVLLSDSVAAPQSTIVALGAHTTMAHGKAALGGEMLPTSSHTSAALAGSLVLGYLVVMTWRGLVRRHTALKCTSDVRVHPRLVRVHGAAMACCLTLMASMSAVSM